MNIYAEIQKMASHINSGNDDVAMQIADSIAVYCFKNNQPSLYREDLRLFESRSDVDVRSYIEDAIDDLQYDLSNVSYGESCNVSRNHHTFTESDDY